MSDEKWAKFFELLKAVTTPSKGQSWQERRDEVQEKAAEQGDETSLSEFVSWFGGELPEESEDEDE